MSNREKEEILAKLSHAERMLSEGKRAIQKLEEDNSKLRRALEQNMTRLNRMSLDSDNYVDRYFFYHFIFPICAISCLTLVINTSSCNILFCLSQS